MDSVKEDRRLLTKCLEGDREASALFVTRFSGLIYHSVRYTLAVRGIPFTRQDLEDFHNTIFLRLFEGDCRKLRQYQGKNGCSPASWLRVVAVRIVLNHIRDSGLKSTLRQDTPAHFLNLTTSDKEALEPLTLMEQAEQRQFLRDATKRLSPRDRLFMKLYFEDGLGIQEVADALGISIQNAYTVKHRAIQRLRSHLSNQKTDPEL
ncbi:MAG: sigma-70 family RNA polymerase sigma factor [Desulfatiglandaceae bacterium]